MKRLEVIARDGGRCVVCYAQGDLQVHHRTYERIGYERLSDLTTLCADCHGMFHGKQYLPITPSRWWSDTSQPPSRELKRLAAKLEGST